jgi:hypothetical protein
VSDYDDSVEVVGSEYLGDRETSGLSIERRAGYPVANWKYLVEVLRKGGM